MSQHRVTPKDILADMNQVLQSDLKAGAEDSAVSAVNIFEADIFTDEEFYAMVGLVRPYLRKSKRNSTPQNLAQVASAIAKRVARQETQAKAEAEAPPTTPSSSG